MNEATQPGAELSEEQAAERLMSLLGGESEEGTEEEGEEPEVPDTPEDEEPTFTIKVDGEEVTLKQSELIAEAQKSRASGKRFEEAAEVRRKAEAEIQSATQERQQLQHALQETQQRLQMFQVPAPDPSLIESDPQEYLRQKANYDHYAQQVAQVAQQRQYLSQQSQWEQQQRIAQETQRLVEAIPELRDATKADSVREAIRAAAQQHGFTPEEINSLGDSRIGILLHKAAQFDAMTKAASASKAQVTEKVAKLPPRAEKPGVSGKPSDDPQQQAMSRLRKSGSVDDAAALLMHRLSKG
ncbi:MAG: hypothetical protein E6Q97_29265 [Desulfurellales bacterium]|nr:MAG: hypothetical protein E6Q97_29265 [Desulfurellales bacterium]